MFHAPIFRTLIKYTEVSRFCYNLGMLMKSGVTITAALEAVAGIHDYYMYRNFTTHLAHEVKQGKSFSKAFADNPKLIDKLFPGTAQEMIISGEESGSLMSVLNVLGENFENESEEISRNMSTLMEPFMLLIIFGLVITLAVAILIPIYDIVGNFDTGGQGQGI
jgi:type II secretory pathway component PulF